MPDHPSKGWERPDQAALAGLTFRVEAFRVQGLAPSSGFSVQGAALRVRAGGSELRDLGNHVRQ